MKRLANSNTPLPPSLPPVEDQVLSDVSISKLLDQGLLTLAREIKNLTMLSLKGKLAPNDARDLRDHLKLIYEIKDRESGTLKTLTDEQLKAKAKEAMADDSN